jgi:hypothetical protein
MCVAPPDDLCTHNLGSISKPGDNAGAAERAACIGSQNFYMSSLTVITFTPAAYMAINDDNM